MENIGNKQSVYVYIYNIYIYKIYVPSSKHGIGAMVIHPILGIITMGLLNPTDGRRPSPSMRKQTMF
jgi:hypothetical protein